MKVFPLVSCLSTVCFNPQTQFQCYDLATPGREDRFSVALGVVWASPEVGDGRCLAADGLVTPVLPWTALLGGSWVVISRVIRV